MSSKSKMSLINKGFKIVVFLVLFIIVMWQYAVEIYAKFNSVSTTFVSKTVDAEILVMPPMTICMDNGLKPSILKKYGLLDIFDFAFETQTKNFSIWDAFVEASYLNSRDFEITIFAPQLSGNHLTLKVGNNYLTDYNGKVFQIEVKEYHTNIAGTCYQVKSNITMYLSYFVDLNLSFNDSLDAIDVPQVKVKYKVGDHTYITSTQFWTFSDPPTMSA